MIREIYSPQRSRTIKPHDITNHTTSAKTFLLKYISDASRRDDETFLMWICIPLVLTNWGKPRDMRPILDHRHSHTTLLSYIHVQLDPPHIHQLDLRLYVDMHAKMRGFRFKPLSLVDVLVCLHTQSVQTTKKASPVPVPEIQYLRMHSGLREQLATLSRYPSFRELIPIPRNINPNL